MHGRTLVQQHIVQLVHVRPIAQLVPDHRVPYAAAEIRPAQQRAAGRRVRQAANVQRRFRVHFVAAAAPLGERNERRLCVDAQRQLLGIVLGGHVVPSIVAEREFRGGQRCGLDAERIAVAQVTGHDDLNGRYMKSNSKTFKCKQND